ncbi:MAG: hypothetical protein PHW82_06090 [Bacteroidales bacterium]|nr:hypothetical protein [Bacteroidales bacterium]
MSKHAGKYKNDPNRFQYWDYSASGKYYITICTQDREYLFGKIESGEMILSDYGKIVKAEILKMPEYNKRVILDEWIIMPDHVHLLIELGSMDFDNGVSVVGDAVGKIHVGKIHEFSLHEFSQLRNPNHTTEQLKQYRAARRRMIIPKILGKFQMLTSKQINILRNTPGKTNWQHDYYDHIIRDNDDYLRIKNYIIDNPKNWNKK